MLLSLLLLCAQVHAETILLDESVATAQEKWTSMETQYKGELTDQQRFVAHFINDAISMADEDDIVLFQLISECNSLEGYISLIGNGVFYTCAPFSDETTVLSKAEATLKGAGIDLPDCVFAQHYANGPYKHTDCWKVIYGHFEDVDYGDGWIENEAIVDYTLYFCGDDYHLVAMIANEYLDADSPDTFYLLY